MAEIAVVGAGYVGLVTAVCFAKIGHKVTCGEIDPDKVKRLSAGETTIYERGLEALLQAGLKSGDLEFVVGAEVAAADKEFVYLCVETPQGDDGSADLSYLRRAAAQVGPVIASGGVIVNKSTVPVGSTRLVEQVIGRSDVSVVSNPEFLREGSAVQDFLEPDRVVIGADDQGAAIRVAALYLGLGGQLMVTDPASAETIKYASNAFLATKLSFINAIAAVCEAVGADVNDVVLGMGYDQRIGHQFMRPGPGWGGSCFPKDTHALVSIAEEAGYDFSLLKGVIEVNDEQFERVVSMVRDAVGRDLTGVRVAALGLAFKAETDDTRMSPALAVIDRLVAAGADVVAYDPVAVSDRSEITLAGDVFEAATDAEVVVVLTEWDEFKWLDLDRLAKVMATPRIVDTRDVIDRTTARRSGFDHRAIGRS